MLRQARVRPYLLEVLFRTRPTCAMASGLGPDISSCSGSSSLSWRRRSRYQVRPRRAQARAATRRPLSGAGSRATTWLGHMGDGRGHSAAIWRVGCCLAVWAKAEGNAVNRTARRCSRPGLRGLAAGEGPIFARGQPEGKRFKLDGRRGPVFSRIAVSGLELLIFSTPLTSLRTMGGVGGHGKGAGFRGFQEGEIRASRATVACGGSRSTS